MDALEFAASVIGSVAWPVVGLVLVFTFRKPIAELVPLVQRLRYRDFEVEFRERVSEVRRELDRELPKETTPAVGGQFATASQLTAVSPRAAVLEAWMQTEHVALEAAGRLTGNKPHRPMDAFRILEQAPSVDRGVVSLLRDLRGLRNEAAHVPDFALSSESATEYISSASFLAGYLAELAHE